MKANHPLILAAVRRARRTFLLLGLLLMPFSLFIAAAPAWSSEGRNITIAATIMGVVFVATCGFLLWMAWKHWTPERAPVMQALTQRPDDIAWIYEERIDSQAAGIIVAKTYSLKIQMVDRKHYVLGVKGHEREEVLRVLAEIAPQATFGYSRELAKQYKRDPRSLIATA